MNNDLCPLMNPDHGGVKMLVGVDVTGLHIVMRKRTPASEGGHVKELDWHVEKFPYKLAQGIEQVAAGKETIAVWITPDLNGIIHVDEPGKQFKFSLSTTDPKDKDYEILLNLDELLKLHKILLTYFCYTD